MKPLILVLVVILALGATGWARVPSPDAFDSLRAIHPRTRNQSPEARSIDHLRCATPLLPDSNNIRCVGRWSYGPATDIAGRVSGRDTIVFFSRGSGVTVAQFHGGARPAVDLLCDINSVGYVLRVIVQDSWLILGTSGIEIYNVSQPTNPTKVAWINTIVSDLALQDSFLYSVNSESLTVFNIASKTNPYRVGAVADSGRDMAVAGGKAYLTWGTFGWHGMYILDVSDPREPHRAGVLSWGDGVRAVAARGNLCFVSDYNARFHILDMTNPAAPQELSSAGVGGCICLKGNFAYLTNFAVVDIMDSLNPGIVGTCTIPGGSGIWATGDYGYAFTASGTYGLRVVDCRDPVHPRADTIGMFAADEWVDISANDTHAVVTGFADGATVLNAVSPSHLFQIASLDTPGDQRPQCMAAIVTGSTVFMGWVEWTWGSWLYIFSCADSTRPQLIGKCPTFNNIEDMVMRDSFVYAAEYARLEVISTSDFSHPSIASVCTLEWGGFATPCDLCVSDSMAYVADYTGGLRIFNVARPRHATPAGFLPMPDYALSVAVRDTIAFVGTSNGIRLVSVRDPWNPYELSLYPTSSVEGIAIHGNLMCITDPTTMLDISDPANPRVLGSYRDWGARKLCWRDSLIYLACGWNGVVVLQYYGPNGVEEDSRFQAANDKTIVTSYPNPATQEVVVKCFPPPGAAARLGIYDFSGKLLRTIVGGKQTRSGPYSILWDTRDSDQRLVPNGVYLCRLTYDGQRPRIGERDQENRIGKLVIAR